MNTTDIFAPFEMGGIAFNNRMIRSATDESMADIYGNPTDKLFQLYENLAKGGIGGIITGFICVSPEGRTTMPGMSMLCTEDNVKNFKRLTDRIHELNTPIIAQIAHCGRHSVSGKRFNVDKISTNDIEKLINDFTAAIIRAEKAGFDGVQLHIAHGYLLSEFVSPHINHRRDKWGGSRENRIRIVECIVERVRQELPDYPVYVKLNGEEMVSKGLTVEDAVWNSQRLESVGVSAIEVSRSLQENFFDVTRGSVPIDMIYKEFPLVKNLPGFVKKIAKPIIMKKMTPVQPYTLYNLENAKAIKASVSIPVIVVGGVYTIEDAQKAIDEGLDSVAICRPLILEPGLINKWKSGKQRDSKCIRCNYCLIGLGERPLRCYYGKLPK